MPNDGNGRVNLDKLHALGIDSAEFWLAISAFWPVADALMRQALWAALSPRQKVGQHEKGVQVSRVLGQPTIAQLGVADWRLITKNGCSTLARMSALVFFQLVQDGSH